MIRARAPGKVVLWGEYAVLAGAPALVQAVDRHAECRLTGAPNSDGWHFVSRGFDAPEVSVSRTRLLEPHAPEAGEAWLTTWHVLQALDGAELPHGVRLETDTRGFYHDGTKLGLGSSAAVTVACYAACCELLGRTPDYATALRVHHTLQGRQGSGIDIAAAYFGGLRRFVRPGTAAVPETPEAWRWPETLHLAYVWTGVSARTTDHLRRFEAWRAGGDTRALDLLARASQALFDRDDTLDALARYVERLKALDRAAQLGIYGDGHRELDRLAIDGRVVYKPCGAGGGDLGIAVSDDPAALRAFARRAATHDFTPVSLETAFDGIQVTR